MTKFINLINQNEVILAFSKHPVVKRTSPTFNETLLNKHTKSSKRGFFRFEDLRQAVKLSPIQENNRKAINYIFNETPVISDNIMTDDDRRESDLVDSLEYLGSALRFFLQYLEIPQKELARHISISEQHLSAIINNKRKLNLELFRRISNTMMVPVYLIFLKASMLADDKSIESKGEYEILEPHLMKILDSIREKRSLNN